MSSHIDGRPNDLPGIQYMRGAAALFVVVYHLAPQAMSSASLTRITTLRSGVDMFFVVSGFVIVYSTDCGTKISARLFILKRIARIVPPVYRMARNRSGILCTCSKRRWPSDHIPVYWAEPASVRRPDFCTGIPAT